MTTALARVSGQLIVGGFAGTELPPSYERALAAGERGGAILFRRNIDDVAQTARLTSQILALGGDGPPLVVGVDQEGGRVARLPRPALVLPPMRHVAAKGRAFVERVARVQGRELRALGFTMNFAPVLDVHTREENPIIGDRALGTDARSVAELGVAYGLSLQAEGVLACGKHYPGHGDTTKDSHLDLPVVDHDAARLMDVELAPFRAAAQAGLASLMTAHVMYPALDPVNPATMSRAIATTLLRETLGFRGVLISDDLEMRAVSDRFGVEESAVLAIEAGCDLLLVCSDEALQARAHEALVKRAESSSTFRARCHEAAARCLAMRALARPEPLLDPIALAAAFESDEARAIGEALS